MPEFDENGSAFKRARRSIRNALREHALLGRSVPIGGPGKNEVIWLTPAEILEDVRRQEEAEKAEELAEAAAAK